MSGPYAIADSKILDDWHLVMRELAFSGKFAGTDAGSVARAALNRSYKIRERVMEGEDDE
jgi:hypothetical protein